MGGMVRAIEQGLLKRGIEDAAARRQARIHTGRDTVVGVNRDVREASPAIDVRRVDAGAVRDAQVARLATVRAGRDGAAVARDVGGADAQRRDGPRRLRQPARAGGRRRPGPRHAR